jgi:hypothetical protein
VCFDVLLNGVLLCRVGENVFLPFQCYYYLVKGGLSWLMLEVVMTGSSIVFFYFFFKEWEMNGQVG